jgi:hypothetical protein
MRKVVSRLGLITGIAFIMFASMGCGSLEKKSVMDDGIITLEEFTQVASANGYVVEKIDVTSGYVACSAEDMESSKNVILGASTGDINSNVDVNIAMYVPYEDMDKTMIPEIDNTINQFKETFKTQDGYSEIDGGFAVTGDSVFIMVNKGESIMEFIGSDKETLLSMAKSLGVYN